MINVDKNYEVCLRFSSFNQNIYNELLKSLSKNALYIFEMVENHNKMLEEEKKKDSSNMLKTRMEELFSYAKRTNYISEEDIKKIIEVKNA